MLAGEDSTDRQCLRVVLEAVCPTLRGRTVELGCTIRLRDATSPSTLCERVDKLSRLVKARAAREGATVGGVFVHEDYDAIASTDRYAVRARVAKALQARIENSHYVLATWEIEAWLLLFPAALSGYHKSWKVPARYVGKDTARIADPKRVLANEVCRSGPRYRESDASKVLAKAAELGVFSQMSGTNCSWDEFTAATRRW